MLRTARCDGNGRLTQVGMSPADLETAGWPRVLRHEPADPDMLVKAMDLPDSSCSDRWDIFCRVVDNLGDIGVCWRLARILSKYHGVTVRLWVDDPEAFLRLCPEAGSGSGPWYVEGAAIHAWTDPFTPVEPAQVVIEAFACNPPESYVEAMARSEPRPLWVNLEYLSAESWVEDCHLRCSPHPRLPLLKYFFIPGFSPATGGLLREPDLLSRRDRHLAREAARESLISRLGLGETPPGALVASLFAYEQPALPELMHAWAGGPEPFVLLVPEGRIVNDVGRFFGTACLRAGAHLEHGGLKTLVLPFSSQPAYDDLLWSCDLNFVRGEDSFVRAQWAARPFVWQIYPQDEDTHVRKLEAFLDRLCIGLDAGVSSALREFWLAWNGHASPASTWPRFAAALPSLRKHCVEWCEALSRQEDLASALVRFARDRLK